MKQDTNPLYSDLKIRHDCVFPNVKMTVEAEYQYSLGLGAHYHNETSECNRTIIVKKTNRGINRIEWQQPWAEFDKRTKSRQIQFGQIRFEYEFDPPENHVIKYKRPSCA